MTIRYITGVARQVALCACLCLVASTVTAGIRETLDAIEASEFRFARAHSEVPFMPLGWAQTVYYPNSRFEDEQGILPGATVAEYTLNLGGAMPAYVASRDMLLVGGDCSWDQFTVKSGPYRDQSVLRLTPVTGWLHQFGRKDMAGAFVAPIFSQELRNNGSWGVSGYTGVVGIHWFNDDLQLLYGGIYQNSFGTHAGYPYLGLQWAPTPKTSLALVFPWPTFTYAPTDRWIVSVGIGPGGSSWVSRGNGEEATESLGSWNLTAGAGYRFYEKLWLFAGVGVAGLRGVDIESSDSRTRYESKPGAVFTIAVQFRP